MAKKKKGKLKRSGVAFADRLVELLERGQAGDLPAEAAAAGISPQLYDSAFSSALDMLNKGPDPRKLVELPAPFQVAFLKIAGANEDDELISDLLGMTSDKKVKKEAKRILHRLRSRGLSVDVPEEKGKSVLDRAVGAEDKPLPCYLSPVSGDGNRMVMLARYSPGGVAIHQGQMSDSEGLTEFTGGTIGRNHYRRMIQEQISNSAGAMLEVEYAEARLALARAVDLCREAGKSLPNEYLEASGNLGLVAEGDEGAALPSPAELFPAGDFAEQTDQLLAMSPGLLDLPEFGDWVPDLDTLQKSEEKIGQIKSSRLTINDQQRIDQVQLAMDGGVESLLDDEDNRRRFHERLLENAVYLQRTGREEQARQAAAAAWQILTEGFKPGDSLFFDRMVKKLFHTPEEIVAQSSPPDGQPDANDPDPDEDPSPGNLIITP